MRLFATENQTMVSSFTNLNTDTAMNVEQITWVLYRESYSGRGDPSVSTAGVRLGPGSAKHDLASRSFKLSPRSSTSWRGFVAYRQTFVAARIA